MAKTEVPLGELDDFIPPNSFELVAKYLKQYKVHLTITRARTSVLGDYRNNHQNKNHRISVNGNLNPFAFLVTLLHELAHLVTFEQHGNQVQSHGREWKNLFGLLLKEFLNRKIFSEDIALVLTRSLHNPSASSCADSSLVRILKKYDKTDKPFLFVEDLPEGSIFRIKGGRLFKKGDKRRTRFRCMEMATGKEYLFSPVYEVLKVSQPNL